MADDKKEDKEEAPAPAAAPQKKGKLGLILGMLGLMIISAGVPTAFFTMKSKKVQDLELPADAAATGDEAPKLEGSADTEELAEDEERLGAMLPLETFLVNLSGGKYLRAQVSIEFTGIEIPKSYFRNQVIVRDGLIGLLSRKAASDLDAGPGRDKLKKEVRELINEVLKHEEVKRVYFTQFVIQ